MIKSTLVVLCIVAFATGLHIDQEHDYTIGTPANPVFKGVITLQSDIGTYLSLCNTCGPSSLPDSASVHETNIQSPWVFWSMYQVGLYDLVLKARSGKYLARCTDCWVGGVRPDSAFVHSTSTYDSWAKWRFEKLSNGKWAIKSSDSGKYLSRCYKCVPGSPVDNFAFVHVDTPVNNPWAQWTIINR